MSDRERFLRQVLLPEIGEEGQRRISARAAAVGSAVPGHDGAASGPIPRAPAEPSLAHEVAGLYARGAGFSAVTPGLIDTGALAPEAIVTVPAAREVLAGSRAALAEIRRAITEGHG